MSSLPTSTKPVGNTADIIVVGGGGAALAAAAEAARSGCSVIVLEKEPRLGGTTALSVGSLMAAGTKLQTRAGIGDSPQDHDNDITKIVAGLGMSDNLELRKLLLENAAETVNFLESIGVDFTGPLVQPGFATKRFYQALPGGRAYIARLAAHCRKAGVVIHTSTRGLRLEQTLGRVTGVAAERNGEPETFFANRGVVLASGDLSAAKDMREDLWGKDLEALQPLNPASTGDGHRMGLALGAHMVVRPDLVPHGTPRFAIPKRRSFVGSIPPSRVFTRAMKWATKILPDRWLRPFVMGAAMTALAPERALYDAGAIIVNRQGKRFVDERGAVGDAIAKQDNGEAFVVFDGEVAKRFSAWPDFISTAPGIAYAYVDDYRRARKDIFHEAKNLEGLATQLGCDAAALRASLIERNGNAGKPPYIALGPLKTWLLLTQVGLAVDTKLRVLDAEGMPIPGLYAAGGVGQGGLSCTSYHHGHSLAWAFTSGRLAARSAAEDFSPMPNGDTVTD